MPEEAPMIKIFAIPVKPCSASFVQASKVSFKKLSVF
jgi:hypothetical protein